MKTSNQTSALNFIFESYRLEAKMKKESKILNALLGILFITFFMILFEISASAQSMGVNNPNPHAKSLLDLTSTNKGLLTPRMTQAQRIAMFAAPDATAKGMLVYQTDNTQGFYFYDGATWQTVNANAGWGLTGNTGTAASTNFIGTADNNDVVFKTNNTERMRIDVNGNIGIDTVAPKARLHIKSNSASNWPQIIVEEKDSADFSRITFMNKGSNKFWTVAANSNQVDSLSMFNIFNSSTFNLLTVTGTGKVGLSHTNPRQRLEVNGNITLTSDVNNIRVNDVRVFSVAGPTNLFAGENAGINNTGDGNTFAGHEAGLANTSGNWNSFFGTNAGSNNTTGYYNSYFGIAAGYFNTTGINNTAIGNDALKQTTTGSYNTTTGSWAGYSNTTGGHNSFFGISAGYLNSTGGYNTAVGADAMHNNTTGDYNTCTGGNAGYSNTTGHHNSFFGIAAGYLNSTGGYNTALGVDAMHNNTTGDYNTFTGGATGYSNTTGHRNVFNGAGAGFLNTTGAYNTAVGTDAMHDNTTGDYNTLAGWAAGYFNTTGQKNVFSGVAAGYLNTTGSWNTAIGTDALHNGVTGNNNVMVGFEAGYSTTVSNNVMMGFRAGKFNNTGTNNTFVGVNAGNVNTTGSNNVAIGNNAQVGAALTNAIAIGNNSAVTTSNSFVLGGTGVDAVNVGIGTNAPQHKLSFGNDLGSKISFWQGANVNYGIGVQGSLLQFYTATVNDDQAFGYGSSAAFTETMRIKGNGDVGIGTSAPTATLEVNGYTKLGTDAPAVKMKKYTGNTAATTNGNINFAHGLNQAKILSVEVLVLQSGGTLYPPENSTSSGAYYHYFVTSTSVYIANDASNSANILSRPYRVLITYEE